MFSVSERPICRLDQNSTEEKVRVGEETVDRWWPAKKLNINKSEDELWCKNKEGKPDLRASEREAAG